MLAMFRLYIFTLVFLLVGKVTIWTLSLTLSCSVIWLSIICVYSYWHFCQAGWHHILPGVNWSFTGLSVFPESYTWPVKLLFTATSSLSCFQTSVSLLCFHSLAIEWPLSFWSVTALRCCSFAYVSFPDTPDLSFLRPVGVPTTSAFLLVTLISSVRAPTLIFGVTVCSTQSCLEWRIFCFLLKKYKSILNCFNVIYHLILSNCSHLTCQLPLEYSCIPLHITRASNQ